MHALEFAGHLAFEVTPRRRQCQDSDGEPSTSDGTATAGSDGTAAYGTPLFTAAAARATTPVPAR